MAQSSPDTEASDEAFSRLFLAVHPLFVEVGHRINAEDERDVVLIPTVEMSRLSKVGIASKLDVAKSSALAQNGCSVEILCGLFVAGAIAAAVDDV